MQFENRVNKVPYRNPASFDIVRSKPFFLGITLGITVVLFRHTP